MYIFLVKVAYTIDIYDKDLKMSFFYRKNFYIFFNQIKTYLLINVKKTTFYYEIKK